MDAGRGGYSLRLDAMTNGAARPRKVMIGTPAKDGATCVHYTHAFGHTMYQAALRRIDVVPRFIPFDSFIHHARNRLLKYMLEEGCDDILFCDADNDWQAEWVFRLLEHPVDCVGGTYPRKQDAEHYELRSRANPVRRCARTGLLIVDSMGAGFLRLSRRAVQALWNQALPYHGYGENVRLICEVPVIDGRLVGEDTVLAAKLAGLGIATYLDDTMTCGHTGTKRWTGDVRPWIARVEAAVAPNPPMAAPAAPGAA